MESKGLSEILKWIDSKDDLCLIIFLWASLGEQASCGSCLRASDVVFKILAYEKANGGMEGGCIWVGIHWLGD